MVSLFVEIDTVSFWSKIAENIQIYSTGYIVIFMYPYSSLEGATLLTFVPF